MAALLLVGMPLGSLAAGADAGKGLERVDLAPLAKGDAVLEVTTPSGPQAYDLATIEELGVYRLTTPSPYDDGSPTFEGVLLSDLLAKDGLADAEGVELSAADGYSQVIPREDWESYPVLLATRQDGAPLVDRGPLRIIYPISGHPELAAELYQPRWVWQIKSIKAVDR
ncbi:MAG: molybdopterin-dependent oxidoreductase [Geminicoccaceae bacterium]